MTTLAGRCAANIGSSDPRKPASPSAVHLSPPLHLPDRPRGAGQCSSAPIRSGSLTVRRTKIYKFLFILVRFGHSLYCCHAGRPDCDFPDACVFTRRVGPSGTERPRAWRSKIPSKDWTEAAQCAAPGCCLVMLCRWRPICLLLRSSHTQRLLGARPSVRAGWQHNKVSQLQVSDGSDGMQLAKVRRQRLSSIFLGLACW